MSETPLYGGTRPPLSLRFNITAGTRAGQRLEIVAPSLNNSVVIGRSRDCAIYIEAADVSRRHAEIFLTNDGRYYIHDLGSRNGTLVNGRPATQETPLSLSPGTMITIGTNVLIFEGFNTPLSTVPIKQTVAGPSTAHPENPTVLGDNVSAYLSLVTGQRFLLEGEQLTVGRAVTNQIVIEAKSISRYHARLQRIPTGYTVVDLGSTNKTYVNNQLAENPILLHSGDMVRFGDVVSTYELEQQEADTADPPQDVDTTNPDSSNLPEMKTRLDFSYNELQTVNEAQSHRRNLEHGETRLNFDVRDLRAANRGRPSPNQPSTSVRASVPLPPGVVILERVSKTYEGNSVLQGVNLVLRQGELISVLGPDTSARNALERILVALEPADQGFVQLLGRNIPVLETNKKSLNLEEDGELAQWRNSNIGYLSPEFNFNNRLTVLEIITSAIELITGSYNRAAVIEQAWEQLRSFGLTRLDLDKVRSDVLTSNDRRKLALARVFAPSPALTVLHDPTVNLTNDEVTLIIGQFKLLTRQGKTIVVLTQDRLWERIANRHYELTANGEILGG